MEEWSCSGELTWCLLGGPQGADPDDRRRQTNGPGCGKTERRNIPLRSRCGPENSGCATSSPGSPDKGVTVFLKRESLKNVFPRVYQPEVGDPAFRYISIVCMRSFLWFVGDRTSTARSQAPLNAVLQYERRTQTGCPAQARCGPSV